MEDTCAQVCWASAETGPVTLAAGPSEVKVESTGAPGSVVLEGLAPGTGYTLSAGGREAGRFATLASPPGRLLSRFATISDLHVGEPWFGAVLHIAEGRRPEGTEPYAVRCARAAVAEAVAWGAEVVVVKGDLTYSGSRAELEEVGRLLAAAPVPLEVVPGNHDVAPQGSDMRAVLAAQGLRIPSQPWCRDLPGVRLVLGLSAVPGSKGGKVGGEQRRAVVDLAGASPAAAFVVFHHYPQRFERANIYPPGIPVSQARPLLDALAAANPATLVTSGHTHRHRRHRHGPLVVTETGSTKDYPGTWAGYAVHEGGIRQVVRRVAAPDCIAWTERTRRAVGGLWGHWSPGTLAQRCFTHPWPAA